MSVQKKFLISLCIILLYSMLGSAYSANSITNNVSDNNKAFVLKISDIKHDSVYEKLGLKNNDTISKVNGELFFRKHSCCAKR